MSSPIIRTHIEQSPILSFESNLPSRQLSFQKIADAKSTSAVGSRN